MKWYATIGLRDFESRDQVANKNIISQLLQRLQSSHLVGTHMTVKLYHCYMS